MIKQTSQLKRISFFLRFLGFLTILASFLLVGCQDNARKRANREILLAASFGANTAVECQLTLNEFESCDAWIGAGCSINDLPADWNCGPRLSDDAVFNSGNLAVGQACFHHLWSYDKQERSDNTPNTHGWGDWRTSINRCITPQGVEAYRDNNGNIYEGWGGKAIIAFIPTDNPANDQGLLPVRYRITEVTRTIGSVNASASVVPINSEVTLESLPLGEYRVEAFCDLNNDYNWNDFARDDTANNANDEPALTRDGVSPNIIVSAFDYGSGPVAVGFDQTLNLTMKNVVSNTNNDVPCDNIADPLVIDMFSNGVVFDENVRHFNYDNNLSTGDAQGRETFYS